MDIQAKRRFNHRAFVSITMVLSGLGLPVTGIMNHALQMEPLTVQRHAWMSAHNILALLFSIFCIWHIVLNRGVLAKHIKGLAERVPAVSREAVCAIILVGSATFVVVGHAFHLR